jgi:hypothetical protein
MSIYRERCAQAVAKAQALFQPLATKARMVRRAAMLLLLLPGAAWADTISSNDLFLSPTAVPIAIYDPIDLLPGGSFTFSTSNVSGATSLLAVHILPILNPYSLTSDGHYTMSALANINALNYSSYYAFQPNVDYSATTISGNSSVLTFGASGVYYVQLETSNGTSISNSVFRVQANDFLAEDPAAGAADATGAERKITMPVTDLTIISDGDPKDNGAMANAMKQFPDAVKAKTIQEVIDAIKKYYDDHGKKKFEVTIIGHGRDGSIKIGKERINDQGDSNMSVAKFQKMVDKYVSSIHFGSCNTASGASGSDFLKALAASIKTVTAYDDEVTYSETYVDIGAMGKLQTAADVPEPGTYLIMILGFGVLGARLRGQRARGSDARLLTNHRG